MHKTNTLEDFTAWWIFEKIQPGFRSKIRNQKMSENLLRDSVRNIILERDLLNIYMSQSWWQEIMIDDNTIANLTASVTSKIVSLCQEKES